ncbi:Eukaryotic translation initiation factor 2-alpha kinase, variant 2 [Parelaphostrongylus tenuis]|uniref:non-specific serine/threonine protein kinase n=1 Tax=Parelaphostrongylus tenuis TaxID=148309 RepID=A0AAD5QSC6_PARTN|nr:Eukaryotic translation initiation factor 2-alpha kinase, variant 2 [Parelaphostrongylus tenuis]
MRSFCSRNEIGLKICRRLLYRYRFCKQLYVILCHRYQHISTSLSIVSFLMVGSQKWVLDADAFLATPPLKFDLDKLKNAVNRHHHRTHSGNGLRTRSGMLRLLLAAFLDVFCGTLPESHREHVKHELSLTLVKLKVVPSLTFAEEFTSVRKSFACVLSSVLYSCFTSDPKVDCRLSPENYGSFLSRYHTDFEEIEQIGAGGFGTVWKVKSLLDKCYYAIKRIPVKCDFTPAAVLSEVHILAMLQHENIVRYHCGWTEMHQMSATKKIKENQNDDQIKITELDDFDTDVDSCEQSSLLLTETEDTFSPTASNRSPDTGTSDLDSSLTESAAPRRKFWARGGGDRIPFPDFSDDSAEPSENGAAPEVLDVEKCVEPNNKVRTTCFCDLKLFSRIHTFFEKAYESVC